MFTSFLIGTLAFSVLALVILLAMPKAAPEDNDRLPLAGMLLAVLLAALAFIGGMAVSG